MNFLDAHKILYDYIDTLQGTTPIDGIIRKRSELKNSPSEIISAYKIFLAHMFFYHTRTQEEYGSLQLCINQLPSFINDNEANKYIECKKIVDDKSIIAKWRNKAALPLAEDTVKKISLDTTQALVDFYSSEESKALDSYTKQILNEAKEAANRVRALDIKSDDGWRKFNEIKDEYCSKAYSLAGIPEDKYSIDFFYPFSHLKALVEHPSVAEFYAPYKSYVLSNR